jgi:hypothetical protein
MDYIISLGDSIIYTRRIRSTTVNRQRRNQLRTRSTNNSFRLSQRKKQATQYKEWQAHQIKIWEMNNQDLLAKESILKNLSRSIDKRGPELL